MHLWHRGYRAEWDARLVDRPRSRRLTFVDPARRRTHPVSDHRSNGGVADPREYAADGTLRGRHAAHVLEESFTLVLASFQHIRNVAGRKSDRSDAAWIADLLAHEQILGSFGPPSPLQELRDLMPSRKQLVGEIAGHTPRLQNALEDANV